MYKSLFVVAFVGAAYVHAAQINEACANDGACTQADSYCKIKSPSCGSGVCTCSPPYSFIASENACRQIAPNGGSCEAKEHCKDSYADCVAGKCQCSGNYVAGPSGGDCVHRDATLNAGDECFDSVQCYYDMTCRGNKCGCPVGMKQEGAYGCAKRQPGDSCQSDADCSKSDNTVCSSGKCSCASGTSQTTTEKESGAKEQVCVVGGKSGLPAEGSECQMDMCQSPFVCTQCGGPKPVCGRKKLPLSGGAAQATFGALTFVAAAAALL